MRVCNVPKCPTLYEGSEGRCPAHRRVARGRRTDNAVYSTKGHRAFRNDVLEADPICVLCHAAQSTVADHYPLTRRELVARDMDPNDPQHGRGLCAHCHNLHTAHTSPGGWHATQ